MKLALYIDQWLDVNVVEVSSVEPFKCIVPYIFEGFVSRGRLVPRHVAYDSERWVGGLIHNRRKLIWLA